MLGQFDSVYFTRALVLNCSHHLCNISTPASIVRLSFNTHDGLMQSHGVWLFVVALQNNAQRKLHVNILRVSESETCCPCTRRANNHPWIPTTLGCPFSVGSLICRLSCIEWRDWCDCSCDIPPVARSIFGTQKCRDPLPAANERKKSEGGGPEKGATP